jgi:predicted nucleic acid-binding protein
MSMLVDTNILLRSINHGHALQKTAVKSLMTLRSKGFLGYITPQILTEFWHVCTRPAANNGLGYTPQETYQEIQKIKRFFPLLPDVAGIYPIWEQLVLTHQVSGKNVYDTRLVACMLEHGLTHILTYNKPDFRRFLDIKVLDPQTVVEKYSV